MRRISHWEKKPRAGDVHGVALQYLGLDCYASWAHAWVYPVLEGGWDVLLERTGHEPVRFHEGTRHRAMMRVEHEIAERWGKRMKAGPGVDPRSLPDPVPLADLTHFKSFWKKKPPPGPQPQPRYMDLLTPEIRRLAKLPPTEAMLEATGGFELDANGKRLPDEVIALKERIRRDELELERLTHGVGKTVDELTADGRE